MSPLPAGLLRPEWGRHSFNPPLQRAVGHRGSWSPPGPARSCPVTASPGLLSGLAGPPGGAARGAVGPGADACEGAGPWATSSSQGATRQGPEPGQDRARVGPQRPTICQPAPAPGSPEGSLCTSLGTPASPGTAPQRWPARGWICGGRGAGGPGGARVSRQSPARPCWSSSNTGPRGAPPPRSPPHPHGVLCRGEGGPRNQQKDKSEGVVMAVGGPGRAERPGAQRGTGRRRAAAGGRGGGAAREGRRHRDSEPSPERDPPSRARVPAPRAPSVQTDARCTCVVPCRGQVCACGRAAERGRVCAGVCTSVALRWGGRPEPVL